MKGSRLSLTIDTYRKFMTRFPPNCRVLVRAAVGDQLFGLVGEPRNRTLFLASPFGYWEIDVLQLVSTFADQVKEWQLDDDTARGHGLTGRIVADTHVLGAPPAYVRRRIGRTRTKAATRSRRRSAR